jgi:uncharacterized protein YeaO (DUF488 family)
MAEIRVKRIYEPPAPDDGRRVLVDRIWPRGVSRGAAAIDLWCKEAAPTPELRRWFAHDPAKWPEFQKRYRGELAKSAALPDLRRMVRSEPKITLLFAAKDVAHNNAVVLRDMLARPSKSE